MEWAYLWSEELIKEEKSMMFLPPLEISDVEKIRINNIPLSQLPKNVYRYRLLGNEVTIQILQCDLFGELVIKRGEEVVTKLRAVPWKLSGRSEEEATPQEVYQFVVDVIFGKDLKEFLTLIIKYFSKELKATEAFSYTIIEDFPFYLIDFLYSIVESVCIQIREIIPKLFLKGPIHKEVRETMSNSGGKLVFGNRFEDFIQPYPVYKENFHDYKTAPNVMLFQTVYFIMQIALRMAMLFPQKADFKDKCENIVRSCALMLDKYNLWMFFSEELLNATDLCSKIINLENLYYHQMLPLYNLVKMLFVYFPTIAPFIEDPYITVPLDIFYGIYETWAISKILNSFINKGFDLEEIRQEDYAHRSTKMIFSLQNKSKEKIDLIWRLRYRLIVDSTYYRALLRDEFHDTSEEMHVEPDITIVYSGKKNKAIIGDVKFRVLKTQLPDTESLYKVLAYLEDLKKSPIFQEQHYDIEGILIYPGNLQFIRIPPSKDCSNYINIVPLNCHVDETGKIVDVLLNNTGL